VSNLNATELEHYLGERIVDRFREMGAVLAFDWESHRGRRAA
jgi:DNA replication protein DnaC